MPTLGPCPTCSEIITQVDQLVAKAEGFFGPRDKTYSFEGVSFVSDGPHILFPHDKSNGVAICLNMSCIHPTYYPDQLLYQLSHEIVHLLDPDRCPPTTMLEEGAAVWFSIHAPAYWSDDYAADADKRLNGADAYSNYGCAYRAYCQLIQQQPNFIKIIRSAGLRLSNVSAEIIKAYAPRTPDDLAHLLSEHRVMRLSNFGNV